MAAHRYWRALGLEPYGSAGLEISEFHLLAITTRVDAPAALTANIAPTTGALANLKDGSVSTGAAWSAADVRYLILSWDFGSGGSADVTDIRIGSTSAVEKFLLIARIQWSDDASTWVDLRTFVGIAWPGKSALTLSSSASGGTGGWSPTDKAPSIVIGGSNQQIASGGANVGARAVWPQATGKWQFEVTTTATTTDSYYIGVGRSSAGLGGGPGVLDVNSWGQRWDGTKWVNGGPSGSSGAFAIGDVTGVVVDFSLGTVRFYRNGNLLHGGDAFTGLSGTLYPMIGGGGSGSGWTGVLNTDLMAFPVAGATPWLSSTPQILVNPLRGRAVDVSALSVATAASVAKPFATRLINIRRGRKDYLLGGYGQGIGRVRGFTLDYVDPLNKPYPCRVRLVREVDGVVVREQWSKADGSYDFQDVDELQSYTVLAYYLAHAKRAVVADGLTLANGKVELMA